MNATMPREGHIYNGTWVPPMRRYNLTVNDIRVWSGDAWPPAGMIDAVSHTCRHTGGKFGFLNEHGMQISY